MSHHHQESDRPPPYVGVSGITTPEQAQAILDMWPKVAPARSLMLGVLTSQKVLDGGERNARSAAPGDIKSIFLLDGVEDRLLRDRRVLGLVHYFTKDTNDLGNQLLRATAGGGVGCHGVQINVPWPPPEQIMVFRDYGDYDRVVLQVGPKMLSDFPRATVAELVADREYRGLITDVLIDVSAGRGLPIDRGIIADMAEFIRAWNADLGIGIAGGLCAETLHTVADLVREYDLSIDAEGRLRNDRDELDLDKVRAYLDAAARIWGWVS